MKGQRNCAQKGEALLRSSLVHREGCKRENAFALFSPLISHQCHELPSKEQGSVPKHKFRFTSG